MVFREHAENKGFFVDKHGLSYTRGFILSLGNIFGEQAYNKGLSLRGVWVEVTPPASFDRFFLIFLDSIVYLSKKIRCAACSHFATLEDLFGGWLFDWHIFFWQAWGFVNMTPDFADRHGVS